MAQSQQTYQPYFQKGQCVNYEYSYKVICRNIGSVLKPSCKPILLST